MRNFIISLSLLFCLTELAYSQSNRGSETYGARGLALTEKILSKLDIPSWCWNGGHIFERVKQNFRLVDGELLDQYLDSRPESGLIDPQDILDSEERDKIEELIAGHDMKSAMPLSINVLRHGQNLSLTEDDLKLRLLKMSKNKSAIVVFYFYGYARGAKGYVLLEDQGFIEDWEVEELFLKSAKDANILIENFSALERFVTDISKRSYWIEQRLMPPVIAEKSDALKDTKSKQQRDWNAFQLILTEHTMTIILALWVIAAGAWYYLWSRKWRKFVMPDSDVPVRLGADYGATVSDLIEFSDPKASIAEQYEKLKNREL